jgi:glycerate dehydrogenase
MRIVITDGFELNPGDLNWDHIHKLGEVSYFDTTSKEKVIERCAEANIIIVNKTIIDARTIETANQLELVAVTATGYNNIDLQSAKQAGVIVCNVPEYGTFSVAQHAFALLLELVNKVGVHAASVRNGEWHQSGRWSYSKQPLTELKDKTLGIVGLGKIGNRVAEIAKAFGMRIIFSNRSPKASPLGEQVTMEELFRESDVVSLHCPLTKDNEEFVNNEYLSLMQPSALLINTSRGQLINEQHLADALQNNILAGAALDVLSVEPPPIGHPLIGLHNCIITPHNAWLSFEARSRIMDVTYKNITKYLEGYPQNVVN